MFGPGHLVQRKIVMMCNVADRDLRSVVDDIRSRVAADVSLPRGYHAEYGGQFESAERASRTLTLRGAWSCWVPDLHHRHRHS